MGAELWLAIRDGIGLHSTVILEGNPVLIQDLPVNLYDLYHQGELIGKQLDPNTIPGFLLLYSQDLQKKGFEFKQKNPYDAVSGLEAVVKVG